MAIALKLSCSARLGKDADGVNGFTSQVGIGLNCLQRLGLRS
jgi:hypothetical protein